MNNDEKCRIIFEERIKKGLLGPGSDIFIKDDSVENEIISDYPLQRYYTGILFPEKDKIKTMSESSDDEISSEVDGNNENISPQDLKNIDNNGDNNFNSGKKDHNDDDQYVITQNSFFPTNIGLTFCTNNDEKEIRVKFSFGTYSIINEEIKIKAHESIYKEFQDHETFPFKDKIDYQDGYLILKHKFVGRKKSPRSGDFSLLDNFKMSDDFKDNPIKYSFHFFEKLIGKAWKRDTHNLDLNILISDISIPKKIFEKKLSNSSYIGASYTLKTYKMPGDNKCKYIKIQLINTSDTQSSKRFTNSNEILNQKALFQSKIEIFSKQLLPYRSYNDFHPLDREAELLTYLYKDVQNFGIGHNCSVEWGKNYIQTTFLPTYDIKDTLNTFNGSDFSENPDYYKNIEEQLDIYNLSHFSKSSKDQVIDNLNNFILQYEIWINKQKDAPSRNSKIEEYIFNNLNYNLNRLKSNITLLRNEVVFRSFCLANTAMFIQIILSNDENLAAKEKDISEINMDMDFSNLDYFKNYNFDKSPFGRPKYRPFQLAFLILNIDSITELNSPSRNEIVDLIWFPTGGGKTEAYLSVAAFTIIYRRLSNQDNYNGTSVIMRYTLRLLTSQQFERTSKLIAALEFLRRNFENELMSEPITIGMWVGMSSTPNLIKVAEGKVSDISEEANKPNGNPNKYNVFQISSCPWCGTKLISKNKSGNWVFGFDISGNVPNKKFNIKCLNNKCPFHHSLPVQVVDEMLYISPPTLLFATVDKFAMLAWKQEGHRFFNSLSESGLPPDLIIQDELHLLTGPLGSITGIFESVVELLCTKNKRKPKIISSTATTRNTTNQVKALYGINRKVNIFPPNGLSYKDSFFAKVSENESKRRYKGFLPTGKSSIDTQLQLIVHLLVSRLEVYNNIIKKDNMLDFHTFDKYWTVVSYYNSLKDVGRIHNKISDEIYNFTSVLQNRLWGKKPSETFNYLYLYNRDKELTSRIDSSKIKHTLNLLEENEFNETTIQKLNNGNSYIEANIVDIVLATNMFSVGIDIDRLNIMLINGQPKNIAEYIQASSRVGRKYKGLVLVLLDANRSRDKSYFEHFIPFHNAFYKSVEPLSLTPFTENTLQKMLASLVVTYLRHKFPNMNSDKSANNFSPEMLDQFKAEIKQRYKAEDSTWLIFENKLKQLSDSWLEKISNYNLKYYYHKNEVHLLDKPSEIFEKTKTEGSIYHSTDWSIMQSMREIDTSSFIKIELPKVRRV